MITILIRMQSYTRYISRQIKSELFLKESLFLSDSNFLSLHSMQIVWKYLSQGIYLYLITEHNAYDSI